MLCTVPEFPDREEIWRGTGIFEASRQQLDSYVTWSNGAATLGERREKERERDREAVD